MDVGQALLNYTEECRVDIFRQSLKLSRNVKINGNLAPPHKTIHVGA
jgi:hypothetical protein